MRSLALLSLGLFLVGTSRASAHLGSTKFVEVHRADDGVALVVSMEQVDAAVAVGLDPSAPADQVLARAPAVARFLADHIRVRGRTACHATPGAVVAETRDGREFVRVSIAYRCEQHGGLVLEDDAVFPDDRQHEAIVRWGPSGHDVAVLRRGRQRVRLGLEVGLATVAGRFLVEGALHFATGYDHVLFLLSLVLPAGLVARARGPRRALRDVAWLVTAFTVGHSLTLALAALGIVVLPSKPVEATIAASIVVVALLNLARPAARAPIPWIALGFGLVHGFGFSSVLAEVGMPRDATVVALLAFNVGIELAQLAFVAAIFVPLVRIARHRTYETIVLRGGSAVVAGLGALWLVERIAG